MLCAGDMPAIMFLITADGLASEWPPPSLPAAKGFGYLGIKGVA
jgi:hypothetical protein